MLICEPTQKLSKNKFRAQEETIISFRKTTALIQLSSTTIGGKDPPQMVSQRTSLNDFVVPPRFRMIDEVKSPKTSKQKRITASIMKS